MTRLPRGISGAELVKKLSRYGYVVSRQTGSHIRLTTTREGEHHVTIPNHSSISVGTLSSILGDVALHCKLSKDHLVAELFEQ
jgi:predicted RNA binding protein YcfA (HicA-like mRNA interferase family)